MDENSGLTPREQEILSLLLGGLSLKEIAGKLGVSYKAVDYHRGNLYRKFGIQSMQELLLLFVNKKGPESIIGTEQNISLPKESIPAIFQIWETFKDDTSSANFIVKSKGIYIFSGSQGKQDGYAGVYGFPDNKTGKAMKTMSMLSFKVLGDGNDYCVMLPTTDTTDGGHYCKQFSTQNGQITTIIVNIKNDLIQFSWCGIPHDFIQDNITCLQFITIQKKTFNLMIWDINLYP